MNTLATTRESNIDRRLKALKRANFRMIETELYNYRWSRRMLSQSIKELNLVADSTVSPAPLDQDRVQTSRYLADIVARRAEELMQERRYTVAVLQETARRLDAIEYMLRRIKTDNQRKAKAIESVYFDGESEENVQAKLCISVRTLRRWKRDAVELVAERLGLLV